MRWIIDEYFYSYIDNPYYKCSELEHLLKRIGIGSISGESDEKEKETKENGDKSNSEEEKKTGGKPQDSTVMKEEASEGGIENQGEPQKESVAKSENKTKMTRKEWNTVRQYIGKPRRFSQAFVNEELLRLQNFRSFARDSISRKKQPQGFKFGFGHPGSTEEVSRNLQLDPEVVAGARNLSGFEVSEYVLAIHPTCNHFHSGTVLTIDGPAVVINFISTDLGVQKVADHHVISLSNKEALNGGGQGLGEVPGPMRSSNPFQSFTKDIDFTAMAMLIKMLERKMLLVNELKTFNELAEKNSGSLNEKFYLDYNWTLMQIEKLNLQIKDVAVKFRLRGFGSTISSFGKPLLFD